MDKENRFSTLVPAVVLYILSPIVAELLFGSTPASRSNQLIFESLFYGSGALLIREIARRNELGWTSIFILGFAFGIIEECLCLQSAFNPLFLGNDLSFGRSLGVNWVWGFYIIGYHAIWSITIPILLTELIFPGKKEKSWLNSVSIALIFVLFLLSCIAFYFTFNKLSGYTSSFIHFIIAGLLVLILIALSFKLPVNKAMRDESKSPSFLLVGLIALIASSAWLFLFASLFKNGFGLPAWLTILSGICIIIALALFNSIWKKQSWNDLHRFSLAVGALLSSMFFGLWLLMQMKNTTDKISQAVIICISILLLFLLRRKIPAVKQGK